ncbi:MAG: DHH family phosphoesterase [Prevotella sp.]|nr:DHH family phosphoesterase [Prevotella sp.]
METLTASKHYLRSRYPEVEATVIMPNTDLANSFSYLPGWGDILDYKAQKEEAEAKIADADLIVCLDFNNWDRLGRKSPLIDALKRSAEKEPVRLIRIDHHEEPNVAAGAPKDSVIDADFAIVKPEQPSTCCSGTTTTTATSRACPTRRLALRASNSRWACVRRNRVCSRWASARHANTTA